MSMKNDWEKVLESITNVVKKRSNMYAQLCDNSDFSSNIAVLDKDANRENQMVLKTIRDEIGLIRDVHNLIEMFEQRKEGQSIEDVENAKKTQRFLNKCERDFQKLQIVRNKNHVR